jgi:hypothetical protein
MDWALRRPDLGWRRSSESAEQDERAYDGEEALRGGTIHDDADFSSTSFAANRPPCQASMALLKRVLHPERSDWSSVMFLHFLI